MQIVFVHQNFPAQFGHVAHYLAKQRGHRCEFVSRRKLTSTPQIRHHRYEVSPGPTQQQHVCSRNFDINVRHAHGVYEALAKQPGIQPDLIVGHSGFGSTLFLPELYGCPVINYFEYFFRSHHSDLDFRPDYACRPIDRFRVRTRNAMLLLDMENCTRGYSPTHWQHACLPQEFRPKVEVLFDGIDTKLWQPSAPGERRIGNWTVPPGCKLVTYATRGMEAMRGFDIFLHVAHRISLERSDVVFAIAGEDRVVYGGDRRHIAGNSFKEYLLSLGNYDRTRFHFLGRLPPADLAKLFGLSDLHFYLTVPFVLSWSLFNALSCGATVLASNAGPVTEIVRDAHNGLLLDFFDEDGFVELALRVLRDPGAYRELGKAGRQLMEEKYSYEVCLPRLADFYEQTAADNGQSWLGRQPATWSIDTFGSSG